MQFLGRNVQCRAKSAASLKPKLQERGLFESEFIETEVKDLAGARLIFYTNTDVDRFLNSRLIPDTFEIDRDATRSTTLPKRMKVFAIRPFTTQCG